MVADICPVVKALIWLVVRSKIKIFMKFIFFNFYRMISVFDASFLLNFPHWNSLTPSERRTCIRRNNSLHNNSQGVSTSDITSQRVQDLVGFNTVCISECIIRLNRGSHIRVSHLVIVFIHKSYTHQSDLLSHVQFCGSLWCLKIYDQMGHSNVGSPYILL